MGLDYFVFRILDLEEKERSSLEYVQQLLLSSLKAVTQHCVDEAETTAGTEIAFLSVD